MFPSRKADKLLIFKLILHSLYLFWDYKKQQKTKFNMFPSRKADKLLIFKLILQSLPGIISVVEFFWHFVFIVHFNVRYRIHDIVNGRFLFKFVFVLSFHDKNRPRF